MADIKIKDKPDDSKNLGTFMDEEINYVPATITQYTDVILFGKGDAAMPMNRVTVTHLVDPVWHEPTVAMRAMGVIGYWEYPLSAIGYTSASDVPGYQQMEFHGYSGLKIGVRSFDAVQPGGESGIPEPVWRALAGAGVDPPRLMDIKESLEFDKTHAFRPMDWAATSTTRN